MHQHDYDYCFSVNIIQIYILIWYFVLNLVSMFISTSHICISKLHVCELCSAKWYLNVYPVFLLRTLFGLERAEKLQLNKIRNIICVMKFVFILEVWTVDVCWRSYVINWMSCHNTLYTIRQRSVQGVQECSIPCFRKILKISNQQWA